MCVYYLILWICSECSQSAKTMSKKKTKPKKSCDKKVCREKVCGEPNKVIPLSKTTKSNINATKESWWKKILNKLLGS